LDAAQSVEEAISILNEYDVSISKEEMESLLADGQGELDEGSLEDVAGGRIDFGGMVKKLADAIRRANRPLKPVISPSGKKHYPY
jgi:hypothetical protein